MAIDVDSAWLEPTWFIDFDDARVSAYADRAAGDASGQTETAIRLFHAVRDDIRYDPYGVSYAPGEFRASSITEADANWCVPKSVLLTAAARYRGIPARLGFADVRNHLTSEKLSASMGTDVFAWHGYTEMLLPDPEHPGDVRWFKLSSAFNIELCDRFGVRVLEFDGTDDALMHAFDQAGNRHMEYINERGSFDDLPLDRILSDFAEIYPSMGDVAPVDDDAFDASR